MAQAHPIFGHALVAMVGVARIRYRGGNGGNPQIRESLGTMSPAELVDVSQLLQRFPDGGRFVLTPIGANGMLAGATSVHDVPDASGVLNLIAPMPGNEAGAAAAAGAVPPAGGTVDAVNLYRDLYKLAEASRENDMKALQAVMSSKGGDAGGGAGMVTFLTGELASVRAELLTVRGANDVLRAEVQTLRMTLLKKQMGEHDPMTLLAGAAAERFGLVNPGAITGAGNLMGMVPPGAGGGAPPAAAKSPADDTVVLPTAEELKAMLAANTLPKFVVVHAVKLHQAGGLPPDLWPVLEPVAAIMGLV